MKSGNIILEGPEIKMNKHKTFKSYRRDSDVIRRFADGSTNLVLKPGIVLE